MAHKFQTGLFDCASYPEICAHGFSLFNGYTYSEIKYRLDHPEDTTVKGLRRCNGTCWRFSIMGILLPMACVQEALQRTALRHQFQIEGSVAQDWITSFFCHCCGLVQEDVEAKKWQERQGIYAGRQPATQEPMRYAAQMSGTTDV